MPRPQAILALLPWLLCSAVWNPVLTVVGDGLDQFVTVIGLVRRSIFSVLFPLSSENGSTLCRFPTSFAWTSCGSPFGREVAIETSAAIEPLPSTWASVAEVQCVGSPFTLVRINTTFPQRRQEAVLLVRETLFAVGLCLATSARWQIYFEVER